MRLVKYLGLVAAERMQWPTVVLPSRDRAANALTGRLERREDFHRRYGAAILPHVARAATPTRELLRATDR